MELQNPLATVTPTLDGAVLAVLAANEVSFTTGQIHRLLSGYSQEGIRKVLTRLVVQGVVVGDRVGNAFAYRLNVEHLAAEPIRALARLQTTFMNRLEQYLDEWDEPPVYAAVFGSAARGTMTVHSDLDVFLVRGDGAVEEGWTIRVNELALSISRWTGNDARIVDFSETDLRDAASEPLVRDIVEQGLTVAGSRAWLLRQVRTRIT